MIIRIKKRDLAIASISLTFIIAVIFSLLMPLIYAAATINTTQVGFGVWLTISNRNPTIKLINATGFYVDPLAGQGVRVLIVFNVTDPDGVGQVNATTAVVNLTLGTLEYSQWRANVSNVGLEFGACFNHTENNADVIINCTVAMRYYDNASSNWVINISIRDTQGGSAINDSKGSTPHVFTYNSLSSFSLNARGVSEGANINFSSLNLGDQDKGAKAPLLLNNTGNADFDQIKIMAANLIGISTPAETIAAANFFVNATNLTATPGLGAPLSITANVTIRAYAQTASGTLDNVTLLHGPGISGDTVPYSGPTITKGNQTLVFWIDVPSSGISPQVYNNTWNMTVIDLP